MTMTVTVTITYGDGDKKPHNNNNKINFCYHPPVNELVYRCLMEKVDNLDDVTESVAEQPSHRGENDLVALPYP